MRFWCHSFRSRREKREQAAATAALAGVIIEPRYSPSEGQTLYFVTLPDGTLCGFNRNFDRAVEFALREMERGIGLPTKAR